jgi:hypothetical protein
VWRAKKTLWTNERGGDPSRTAGNQRLEPLALAVATVHAPVT